MHSAIGRLRAGNNARRVAPSKREGSPLSTPRQAGNWRVGHLSGDELLVDTGHQLGHGGTLRRVLRLRRHVSGFEAGDQIEQSIRFEGSIALPLRYRMEDPCVLELLDCHSSRGLAAA